MNTINKITDFFNNVDEIVNDYIDKIEISQPIQLGQQLYCCGFKRISFSPSYAIHLKQYSPQQIKTLGTNIDYLTNTEGDIWINCIYIDQQLLETAFNKFITKFNNTKILHTADLKYKKIINGAMQVEFNVYDDKKFMCKEILKLKKLYNDVTYKLQSLDQNGQPINTITTIQQTEFEIATQACE
jgi:hypothetical protein